MQGNRRRILASSGGDILRIQGWLQAENEVVGACIRNGLLATAQTAAGLAGRTLTPEEVSSLVEQHIKRYFPPALIDGMLQGTVTDHIDNLVQAHVASGELDHATDAARLGASTHGPINMLVESLCMLGELPKALDVAQFAGRTLTEVEIRSLVLRCAQDGNFTHALEAASVGTVKSGISLQTLYSLLDACVNAGQLAFANQTAAMLFSVKQQSRAKK